MPGVVSTKKRKKNSLTFFIYENKIEIFSVDDIARYLYCLRYVENA